MKKAARCTCEYESRRLLLFRDIILFLFRFLRRQWPLRRCGNATPACCAIRSSDSWSREGESAAVGIGGRSFGKAFGDRRRSYQRAFSVLDELQRIGTSVPVDRDHVTKH